MLPSPNVLALSLWPSRGEEPASCEHVQFPSTTCAEKEAESVLRGKLSKNALIQAYVLRASISSIVACGGPSNSRHATLIGKIRHVSVHVCISTPVVCASISKSVPQSVAKKVEETEMRFGEKPIRESHGCRQYRAAPPRATGARTTHNRCDCHTIAQLAALRPL